MPLLLDPGKQQVQVPILSTSTSTFTSREDNMNNSRNNSSDLHSKGGKEPILCLLEDERFLPGYDN